MKLVFRADASVSTGAGHVMRLCAIAETAISRGLDCVFVGDFGGVFWVEKHVKGLGYQNIWHPDNLLAISSLEDILIIDSYTIAEDCEEVSISRWKMVVSIIDKSTPRYDVNISIHPGLDELIAPNAKGISYAGSGYIPFRKSIKRNTRQISSVDNVLVFAGGTDAFGFASVMAKTLSHRTGYNSVTFISEDDSLLQLDSRFKIHGFGDRLDSLIDSSDLVFTSASTSGLEVAVRGIPVGIVSLVDNQDQYYGAMGRARVAQQVGFRSSHGDWNLDELAILEVINNTQYRKMLQENACKLLDFKGSERILDAIFLQC